MHVGNEPVPAGTYALYAFPGEHSWEVVFHKDTTLWGDGRDAYSPANDLMRFRAVPEAWPRPQENLLITFDRITHNGLEILLIWDTTCLRIPLQVDTRSLMEQTIEQALSGEPTAQTYYEAARYLQEEGRDFGRALDYIEKSIQHGGDTYYFYRVKSLILEGLGSYPEAIEAAARSKTLAAREGKDEFVRMNQQNIEKWTKQTKQ
jgi:tetratricopeptide (TPR) repeat protein